QSPVSGDGASLWAGGLPAVHSESAVRVPVAVRSTTPQFKISKKPPLSLLRPPKINLCYNQDETIATTPRAARAHLARTNLGRPAPECRPSEESRRRRFTPAPPVAVAPPSGARGGARDARDLEPARGPLLSRLATSVSHCARSL